MIEDFECKSVKLYTVLSGPLASVLCESGYRRPFSYLSLQHQVLALPVLEHLQGLQRAHDVHRVYRRLLADFWWMDGHTQTHTHTATAKESLANNSHRRDTKESNKSCSHSLMERFSKDCHSHWPGHGRPGAENLMCGLSHLDTWALWDSYGVTISALVQDLPVVVQNCCYKVIGQCQRSTRDLVAFWPVTLIKTLAPGNGNCDCCCCLLWWWWWLLYWW